MRKIRITTSCRIPERSRGCAGRSGPGVRLDGCIYEGWIVPMEYDPLLAKLAVWAGTREHAMERMIRALREYDVGGIRTNIGFFRQILEDPEFRAGDLHTGFIEEFFARAAGARGAGGFRSGGRAGGGAPPGRGEAGWRSRRRASATSSRWLESRKGRPAAMKLTLTINGREDRHRDSLRRSPACRFRLDDGALREADVESPQPGVFSVLMDGASYDAYVEETPGGLLVVVIDGHRFEIEARDPRRWSRKSVGTRRRCGAVHRQLRCRGRWYVCWWPRATR